MTKIISEDKKWPEAFARYGFDAAVGRLFRGIIHNLNGVGQAFLMQTELLNMMFRRTDAALDEIDRAESPEEKHRMIAELRKTLAGRAELVGYLSNEVNVLQKTVQRTSMVTKEAGRQTIDDSYTLGSVIELELEFLNSDGFFKHKIEKKLELADNLPQLAGNRIELQQIIAVLLENASQTLGEHPAEIGTPAVSISAAVGEGEVLLQVCDNGPGVAPGEREKIFAPFYTTSPERLGLGLYLARTMAENFGGSLTCESSPGRTCFILRLPVEGGAGDK